MPQYPRTPYQKVGTSIKPRVTGDALEPLTTIAPAAITSFAGTVSAASRTATFTETSDYNLCKAGSTLIASGDTRIVVDLLGSDQAILDETTTWGAATAITSVQDPISQHKDSSGNVDMYVNAMGGIRMCGGLGERNGISFGETVVNFGGGTIYTPSPNIMRYSINGATILSMSTDGLHSPTTGGFYLDSLNAPSDTLPTLAPCDTDSNTGIGHAAADALSLIAGGVEGIRLVENGGVLQLSQITAGITADVGSAQGNGALLSSFNEISTCANVGDAVTLPSAVAGYKVTIVNNGANAADVFPATDDDCGGGVNIAVSLAAGANITYLAYDVTNWTSI